MTPVTFPIGNVQPTEMFAPVRPETLFMAPVTLARGSVHPWEILADVRPATEVRPPPEPLSSDPHTMLPELSVSSVSQSVMFNLTVPFRNDSPTTCNL